MGLKMITDTEKQKFYVDTKKVEAVKFEQDAYFYILKIYFNNHKIELKFESIEEAKNALERLKY